MCGIAGSFHPDSDEPDPIVDYMLDRIAHRGPDARGVVNWTAATHGHVRLSIMDPQPRSDQPFIYGGVLLSFNGEIWNYRELREQMESVGARFETEGDTEVLAAWLNWALGSDMLEDAVSKLDGQFAFALTESVSGRTWLVRDRYGEVPLYVLEEEDSLLSMGAVRWASERRAFDRRGADAVPVPPGTIWRLGGPMEGFYRLPAMIGAPTGPSDVLGMLRDAVRRRLMADVPVAFLSSGGLDSSIILRLVQELGVEPVAFTSYLTGDSADREAARRICSELEVPLVEVVPEIHGHMARHAVQVIEIPMKVQVEIAQLCLPLAEKISDYGFKVVLSGEGADELFGGYGNLARKATDDSSWMHARRAAVEKMARGNCVRTNKVFMAAGVEARLPFLDRDLIDVVLPLSLRDCPPGKELLKEAGRRLGLPEWCVSQEKRTFQGAGGTAALMDSRYEGSAVKEYNALARELFGGLPRG